jgi:hypothetical protein
MGFAHALASFLFFLESQVRARAKPVPTSDAFGRRRASRLAGRSCTCRRAARALAALRLNLNKSIRQLIHIIRQRREMHRQHIAGQSHRRDHAIGGLAGLDVIDQR